MRNRKGELALGELVDLRTGASTLVHRSFWPRSLCLEVRPQLVGAKRTIRVIVRATNGNPGGTDRVPDAGALHVKLIAY